MDILGLSLTSIVGLSKKLPVMAFLIVTNCPLFTADSCFVTFPQTLAEIDPVLSFMLKVISGMLSADDLEAMCLRGLICKRGGGEQKKPKTNKLRNVTNTTKQLKSTSEGHFILCLFIIQD